MSIPIPDLRPPLRHEPKALNEARVRLGTQGAGARQERASGESLRAAERLLRDVVGGARRPLSVGRDIAKALIELAPSLSTGLDRTVCVELVLRAESIGWRRLWELWQSIGWEHEALCQRLGLRIDQRAAISPRFRERLPSWVIRELGSLPRALSSAQQLVLQHAVVAGASPQDFALKTGLGIDGGLGQLVLRNLIANGPDAWWRAQDQPALKAWASQRAAPLLGAVVERSLMAAAGQARAPAEIPMTPETRLLQQWVLNTMHDPLSNPGRWTYVSQRAREIFEWMLLADTFARILAQFRKGANDDRADFWEKYQGSLLDALYYEASTSPVCMMVFRDLLVVEFGATGNACYFYQAPPRGTYLRQVPLPRRADPRYFKDQHRLELGNLSLRFETKMIHKARIWAGEFADFLGRRGVQRDQTSSGQRYRGF